MQPTPAVDLIEHAADIIVAEQEKPHTAPYHWAGALWEAGMLVPPGTADDHEKAVEARVRTQVAADLLAVIQRMTPVIDAAVGLRGAETDDEICEAWATFDQAIDDYKEQLEAAGAPSGTVGTPQP